MATKKAGNQGKAAPKSTAKSTRGGKRPGAGRKPKAVTEMRDALILPMVEPGPPAVADVKSAATFALNLFEGVMRDESRPIDLRLDCAKEVLNRTIGKPRMASEPPPADAEGNGSGGIHIYMPDNGRKPQGQAV